MADDATKKEEKKGESKKLSKNVEQLVEEISKLSVMELSELVNALQEKFGVSAMPVASTAVAAAPAAADATASEGVSEGGAQNLVMTASGDNKIAVIKALREVNQNWGLKEAKDMTEQLPAEIIKGGKPEEVKDAAEKLKTAGATVEMK
ncbi:MAG: 50S ribosomal protein L7/L12 [Candidatus Woesebacteria bacterium GW2011_GWA1_39_21]|uniref:Large ribosomal subunit protein bL12 n=1 Tax=Candidatus Woesebacteria bacterium GW2011_GWA1_39_21 TaxID=1618550 RepID=A0A0G0N3J2_9BACT|nr:MAG: 50S ribosomal protein L7/L12 [Candidatus Woesebacteria bacterium GW2011_GWA1_39_21]